MLIGFLVYLWYILQSVHTGITVFLVAWTVVASILYAIIKLSSYEVYQDKLTSWTEFRDAYKEYTGAGNNSYSMGDAHDFCLGVKAWKTFVYNKFLITFAIFALCVNVLIPTPKQMLAIVSAPYIVGYLVDVKKDFNDNNTTTDIVQIPRKFVEGIGNVQGYLETVFKEDKDEKSEKVKAEKSSKNDTPSADTDKMEKIIQDAVSLAVAKALQSQK